jgi:hypothetical protein
VTLADEFKIEKHKNVEAAEGFPESSDKRKSGERIAPPDHGTLSARVF